MKRDREAGSLSCHITPESPGRHNGHLHQQGPFPTMPRAMLPAFPSAPARPLQGHLYPASTCSPFPEPVEETQQVPGRVRLPPSQGHHHTHLCTQESRWSEVTS